MIVWTEYDLFEYTTAQGADGYRTTTSCKQCGCVIMDTFESRQVHLRWHNRVLLLGGL